MVTGAAGFIGSHFVDYVLENHPVDQVIGFDCLTYAGNMKNLEIALSNKRFVFVKGDIRNSDQVNSIASKVDAIVNFAAETHVDRSIASSSEFVSTNVLGVNVLLESALEHKIGIFHQISTDEVYGSVETGFSKEEDKLMPRSPYAASKAAADLLVESFRITHGMNTRITRASNNYGTRQFPEKLIPFFITKFLKNEKVPIYGNGTNIREWTHVKDHARAVDTILRNPKTNYSIYNIPGQIALTNIELTKKLAKILNVEDSLIMFVEDRKGHDYRYAIDGSSLYKEFGFRHNYEMFNELLGIIEDIRNHN